MLIQPELMPVAVIVLILRKSRERRTIEVVRVAPGVEQKFTI